MQKSLLVFLLFLSFFSRATHNRAGEITYKRVPPYTKVVNGTTYKAFWYLITVIKYTDDDTQIKNTGGTSHIQDRCVDTLYFGDGTSDWVERKNGGSPLCVNCEGCGCDNCGELIINEQGYRVKKNVYEFLHEYPEIGTFTIRTSDPYRNAGVQNMSNSALQVFYIESTLVINSFSGPNNSPELTVPPVDKACLNKCFTHNPGAYDPDHDSLSFKISAPKIAHNITVQGYSDPVGLFGIHPVSGILTWCSPTIVGEYNIAFVVEEWRRNTSGQFQMVGTVLRDMQVVVRSCPNNDPPQVLVPQDTCVEAGTIVHKKIRVSDPNSSDVVTISAYGGAFSAENPKGTLSNTNGNGFFADFNWQTTCDHIAGQFYKTVFKVEDNGPYKMANYAVYNIRVVPPKVQNVTAAPKGSDMKINWSAVTCSPANNPLVSYKIYRREGCIPFVNEPCQMAIPASSGFVRIGQTNASIVEFIDDNNGDGLNVGQDYSYMVVAVYKDSVQSFGSTQVCARLKRDVPVILNVDIKSTSGTAGSIKIRWSRPLKTAGNFDSLTFPGPYRFDLRYKSNGTDKIIFSSQATYLYQLDTQYVHTPVNTTIDSNDYYVDFFAMEKRNIGSSQKASSVFLSAQGSDRKVDLLWKSKTPWKNYKYTVFRKVPSATAFVAIATTTATYYADVDHIENKKNYCYYILAEGRYSDPSIYSPLENSSQELCITPEDHTPPCTPTLTVDADCPSGFVTVSWDNVRPICSDDVVNYVLYFKATVNDSYQKVFETDTTYYIYDGLSLISGCYAIKAQDLAGNLSAMSPDFCIDNCPEFELPNIFSPNKDGVNDFYKAVKVRQVKEIDLAILDRWGNLVYTTKDPYFQWDGVNLQSNQAVSEGTFFYVCTVYEPRVKGVVKRVLKGYVQVVR